MTESARLGESIRRRRKAMGLTQGELAAEVGFSVAQIVSDIERGRREVKAWELVKIADSLRTPVDRLLEIGVEDGPARVIWRRGSVAASREVEEVFLERARRYALLEQWNGLPAPSQLPRMDMNPDRASFQDVRRMAVSVGRSLDLGSRPAASLATILQEVFRVKIFFENLGDDESAASARGDFGCAVLMNRSQAPCRRNYSLAHELFHLVTWESTQHEWSGDGEEPCWLEHIEKLANAFASHILLPAAEVESQYEARYRGGKIRYPDLVDMAREFEVSTEALVWRLRLAGRLSQKEAEQILGDPEFREADRRTMSSHWTMAPTGALPQRYWRLALGAYRRGEVSLGRLATILEVSVSEVGALVFGENDEQEAATAPA